MTSRARPRKLAGTAYDRTPIRNKTNRVCGWYDDRVAVHTRRWLESHRVKRFDAIAYDAEVLDQLEAMGCEILENTNPETGHKYRCAFPVIREHGIPFDLGWGAQIALPMRHWIEFDAEGRQVEEAPAAGPKPKPVDAQLGLFDGVPA